MRCKSCNEVLSEYEASMKSAETKEFLDLCVSCAKDTGVHSYGNTSLMHEYEDYPEDLDLDNISGVLYGGISVDDH